MIKNVVFDLGNVLADFVPTEFIKKYTTDEQEQKQLINVIFGSAEWIAFDRGTISKAEIQRIAQGKYPELADKIVEILKTWYREITPRQEMAAVVATLKEQGYSVYLLSNAPQDFYLAENQVPVLAEMDGIFISSDWQMIKPEKEIYLAFCQHFQLVPSECLFIDDLASNVEGARRSGLASFIYRKDQAELVADLVDYGIKV